MKTPDAVNALAALAQDSRLAVFRLLVEQGPTGLAAGAIAERLALPPATLSFHLKELANARLVSARQEGRFIFYRANFERMNALIGFLTQNCCRGSGDPAACVTEQPAARPRRSRARRERAA
ncbi:MAG: metalloregulator ArsR/SmtB family transcription factor [Casimicrobiaceae bacterium]